MFTFKTIKILRYTALSTDNGLMMEKSDIRQIRVLKTQIDEVLSHREVKASLNMSK